VEREQMMAKATDISDAYPFVLYLNPSEHVHEYKLVRNASLDNYICVQDIRHMPSHIQKPQWFTNFPILVETRTRKAYRGPSCFKKMISIELPPEHVKRLAKRTKKRETFANEDL